MKKNLVYDFIKHTHTLLSVFGKEQFSVVAWTLLVSQESWVKQAQSCGGCATCLSRWHDRATE